MALNEYRPILVLTTLRALISHNSNTIDWLSSKDLLMDMYVLHLVIECKGKESGYKFKSMIVTADYVFCVCLFHEILNTRWPWFSHAKRSIEDISVKGITFCDFDFWQLTILKNPEQSIYLVDFTYWNREFVESEF